MTGTVHGLPCRCATSAPGCQTLGTLVCAPSALESGLADPSHTGPSGAAAQRPQPRGMSPPAQSAPRHSSSWRLARPVRKAEPARRPPRGRAYLVWCGQRPQLAGSTPTAAALRAPRSTEQLRESGPPPRSLSFSSTTAAGKRKRKRLRGGPRPSAVNAERGLVARGGGSGPGPARGWLAGRSPMPPRGGKRARCARLSGPVRAGRRAARQQGERPRSAPSFGPAAHRVSLGP